MQSTMRFIGFVLVGVLGLSNGFIAQAAAQAPAVGATTVYLPVINKGYPILNDAVGAIEPSAQAGVFNTPLDATPDPDGATIYFTAQSAHGAGVFSVPATGGTVVSITVGAPLTVPFGLAMSTNGQTIYVADPSATVTNARLTAGSANQALGATQGAIFSVAAAGGTPQAIAGTAGTGPRGLEVAQENGADVIYFTGINPGDGAPALMKIPASGGPLHIIAKGAPFVHPVGVAIAKDGTVFVTDDAASDNELGSVFQVKNGQVTTLADRVRLGKPAGVALTLDESLLLVSALDVTFGTSQVLVINLTTQAQGIVNKSIGVNHASGGLHRAHNRNFMAWCGVTAGGGGGLVYRVEFK